MLRYDWRGLWAREDQLAPLGDWFVWLPMAGRGWGKTRVGAETVREDVDALGPHGRIALVARTAADVRDVMVTGQSGLLSVFPAWQMPVYEPSKRLVTFYNGCIAQLFSADEPDLLRGPQFHRAWCDELAAWRYQDETWSNLMFGLRLGRDPRVVATTTPRPTPLIRDLAKRAAAGDGVVVTRGRTADNAANLAGTFLSEVTRRYGGTRLGKQELEGLLLLDTPGALWTHAMLEKARLARVAAPTADAPHATAMPLPAMRRVVVAVDIAVSTGPNADETGILVCGLGTDGLGYVLEDASGKYTPDAWATKVCDLYAGWDADAVVCEVNQGGDLVEHTVQVAARNLKRQVRVKAVRATKGKAVRAEPVSALYEQGRVRHAGTFAELEDQLTTWDASDHALPSPDRLDALVWALSDLFVLGANPAPYKPAPGARRRWTR